MPNNTSETSKRRSFRGLALGKKEKKEKLWVVSTWRCSLFLPLSPPLSGMMTDCHRYRVLQPAQKAWALRSAERWDCWARHPWPLAHHSSHPHSSQMYSGLAKVIHPPPPHSHSCKVSYLSWGRQPREQFDAVRGAWPERWHADLSPLGDRQQWTAALRRLFLKVGVTSTCTRRLRRGRFWGETLSWWMAVSSRPPCAAQLSVRALAEAIAVILFFLREFSAKLNLVWEW